MGHPQREQPLLLLAHQPAAVLPPGLREGGLRPAPPGPVHHVPAQRLFKSLVPPHGVVKMRDGLVQARRRVRAQLLEKMPEAAGGLIELLRPLHRLVADGIGDIVVAAPGLPLVVLEIVMPALGLDIGQGAPVGVAALRADYVPHEFGHAEDVFHHPGRILEHVGVHPLEHIGQLIRPVRAGHVYRVGFVDMPRAEGLDVPALRPEAEGVQRVLQRPAVHPVDLPPGGEDHLARLHLAARRDGTVGLDHAAQAHVGPRAHRRVVIHHRAAVDQHRPLDTGVGVDHGALHDEAARPDDRAGADDGGGVDEGGHGVPRLKQLIRPGQAHIAVAEGGDGGVEFRALGVIIAAFPRHVRPLGGVVQEHDGGVPQQAGGFLDHLAEPSGPENE